MIFTPTLKRKRGAFSQIQTNPLPECQNDEQYTGLYTGFSVEVSDPSHIQALYNSGCFGKGCKSRSCPEFIKQSYSPAEKQCENLVLELEEALFLTHFLKVLKINDIHGKPLSSDQLFTKFSLVKSNFVNSLVAYLYLRSKNWIVKSGTKFGGDFLIYKRGLRYFHASFIVVVTRGETLLPREVKGIQRVAETSDKDVLFLEICPPNDCTNALENLDKFVVSENIIKRFNYNAFVQTK